MPAVRLEVHGGGAAREAAVVRQAALAGLPVDGCQVSRVYLLDRHPGPEAVERLAAVLADPVLERLTCRPADGCAPSDDVGGVVEVGRRPGVTDAEARELEALARRLGLGELRAAAVTRFRFAPPPPPGRLEQLAGQVLANPTVDRWSFGPLPPAFEGEGGLGGAAAGGVPPLERVETVPLADLDPAALAELSRRRLLSLDVDELVTIQRFFAAQGRDPTDAELETLAQTWSEHCRHKTFRARIEFTWRAADGSVRERRDIDGLLDTCLRAATDAVAAPWVRSAFVDNAGIVAYDDLDASPPPGGPGPADLAIKVETHNHPSALEPFGGANTGVGGVVRDILGVSARPIACLDVLCFAPAATPASEVPAGVLHPRRVAEGVVAGVGDYGNKLGLPTVAGAVLYHPGYLGNPLVYCGSVGILPRGSHPSEPQPGDRIVVVGGRTGRDGIHGATFSSADLGADTGTVAANAVQIGDPITEKQVMELVERARDERLYSAVTDCGAGGLSSAVGELAADVGVAVDLAGVPRKYPGLRPWEVWLSESQERMVLAVPEPAWARLAELAAEWSVEVTTIGRLTGDRRLRVDHGSRPVVDLPMDFLHDGCPRRRMVAEWRDPASHPLPVTRTGVDLGAQLLALLADPTVASKEAVIRTYDHEVRAGTRVRPWCGPAGDGPTDAAVCVPLGHPDHRRAFALAVGINPRYGRLDPYRMAVAAVDEVFRNLVAVGADPDRVALLDNFCWGNPTLPDRLGGLVRAAEGCHDAALAYRAPFVSGKDSLYNEFEGQPIPGTLLITGLGIVADRARALHSAPTAAGQVIYLVGEVADERGGGLWAEHRGQPGGEVPAPLDDPLPRYRAVHRAVLGGLVRAAHDPSEGGLAVALAELAIAGRLGVSVEASTAGLGPEAWLFSESSGRLVLVVEPADQTRLEAALTGIPWVRLGTVEAAGGLRVRLDGAVVIDVEEAELVRAWHG